MARPPYAGPIPTPDSPHLQSPCGPSSTHMPNQVDHTRDPRLVPLSSSRARRGTCARIGDPPRTRSGIPANDKSRPYIAVVPVPHSTPLPHTMSFTASLTPPQSTPHGQTATPCESHLPTPPEPTTHHRIASLPQLGKSATGTHNAYHPHRRNQCPFISASSIPPPLNSILAQC